MTSRDKSVWGSKLTTALAVVVFTSGPVWAQSDARLSESLRKHVSSKSAGKVDVIVCRTADEVSALAARHGLRIKKTMTNCAVIQATGAQIEALGAEVDYLSRDVDVTPFMSVTNEAIGADQVWAGVAGAPGFTGAGIGIALIDSGVWTGHRSLAGRVVFAKDFTGDGNGSSEDPFGHGTHIGAIIAGSSPYSQDSTYPTPFRGVRRAPT